MIDIDGTLSFHATALQLREQRAQTIAENLANVDTPHYKARDVDFKTALQQVSHSDMGIGGESVVRTHRDHIGTTDGMAPNLMYRVPTQPSLDGNTVEETVEKAKFGQNAIGYQGSIQFLNSKIRNLMSAIRGE